MSLLHVAGLLLAGGRPAPARVHASTGTSAAPAEVPVEPSREEARARAVEELAGREYQAQQPGVVERFVRWLLEQLQSVELPSGPSGALAVGLLVVVVAVVAALVLGRAGLPGRGRRGRTRETDVFGRRDLTAAEHRAAADRAAAAGDLRTAVLERFRAVVRDLEERAVLTEQPGRTADEAARAAADALPALGPQLRQAARLFDDVRYGDRAATADGEQALRRLDTAVQGARPASPAPGPRTAAPV